MSTLDKRTSLKSVRRGIDPLVGHDLGTQGAAQKDKRRRLLWYLGERGSAGEAASNRRLNQILLEMQHTRF